MRFTGGITVAVDVSPFNIPDHFMWKCDILDDLPNAIFSLAYVIASRTLGANTIAELA
jgi:hypothetical protein